MRSLFLILIILWIPLQGAFAAAVPQCSHEENAARNLNSTATPTSDTHLQITSPEQPMDHNMTSNPECEVNTMCHTSCSTIMISVSTTATPSGITSYTISLISKSSSFIPEQLQRPPLA
ncbi:MAG: hypothetical protein K0U40_03240 [Betaproteobacteria bacterium]|nr:hypothetical protein [Betaproteobacteria bacterium]